MKSFIISVIAFFLTTAVSIALSGKVDSALELSRYVLGMSSNESDVSVPPNSELDANLRLQFANRLRENKNQTGSLNLLRSYESQQRDIEFSRLWSIGYSEASQAITGSWLLDKSKLNAALFAYSGALTQKNHQVVRQDYEYLASLLQKEEETESERKNQEEKQKEDNQKSEKNTSTWSENGKPSSQEQIGMGKKFNAWDDEQDEELKINENERKIMEGELNNLKNLQENSERFLRNEKEFEDGSVPERLKGLFSNDPLFDSLFPDKTAESGKKDW